MTYVMSDIHGDLDRFRSVMDQIYLKADDHLYVLGDVIDGYPYGLDILNSEICRMLRYYSEITKRCAMIRWCRITVRGSYQIG